MQKRKGKGRKVSIQPERSILTRPPNFVAQSLRSIKIRTIATSSTGIIITVANLAQLVGLMALTTTTSALLSPLIRLRRISMWAPVATAGTPVTCSLTWINMSEDFETPPVTYSDTSISFDQPAYISRVPPRSGVSSKWHDSSLTDNMVSLIYVSGTTVDFEIEWLLNDNSNVHAVIAGPTLVAATAGFIYHHPISTLVPVTVNQL